MNIRNLSLSLALGLLTLGAQAENKPLEGFRYAKELAPTGKEWESCEELSLNKEQPRAWFFSFADTESARRVMPEHSAYWQSLNGQWKFNWVPVPEERPKDFYLPSYDVSGWDNIKVPSCWNIAGLQKDGTQKYGTPIYVNQPVIFLTKRQVGDWKNGVMRTPPTDWTTYKCRNEVGSYRRTFTVDEKWQGREVYISFDGVDSFFYLWINGHYVGFSKNSRNMASFNITEYLVKGENTVAVEVYRNSDASFLEAQDMFRLPGIFRTVALYSKPKVAVRDLIARPELNADFTEGQLNIVSSIRNLDKKAQKGMKMEYTLYPVQLYSDKTAEKCAEAASATVDLNKASEQEVKTTLTLSKPHLWSAERPTRYVLVGQLKDKKGQVLETVSTYVGFCKVEIKDTPANEDEFGLAGRYFYVNGKPIKMKGVNRHETYPSSGHSLTHKQMEEEIMLMKRGNINHIRMSHYPEDPYMYYLCDKYGIYVEDEANLESHEYGYGAESLSHPIEWRKAHIARVMEMVHADVNHPCISIWSLGNEAGPGNNFVAAYDALKAFDKRPVQYERNNNIVDMGSNQYPSIDWVRYAVKGTDKGTKYPFHISEYAHSMGNSLGGYADYWKAMESTNFFVGGAIWDWMDQGLYNYTKDGRKYIAFGGDFGDTPTDGQFALNGIILSDRTPKPQYYEVKKVNQYVGVEAVEGKPTQIKVFNKNYFVGLRGLQPHYILVKDGMKVAEGDFKLPRIEPRKSAVVDVPVDLTNLEADSEYFLTIQFRLTHKMPWAEAGYVQAEEQLPIQGAKTEKTLAEDAGTGKSTVSGQGTDRVTVSGAGYSIVFDMKQGAIDQMTYGAQQIIKTGEGPKLQPMRAFTNNDCWDYQAWYAAGLHNLKHKAISSNVLTQKDGTVIVLFTVESQAPNAARLHGSTNVQGVTKVEEITAQPFGAEDFMFVTNQVYTIYPDGSVNFDAAIISNNPKQKLPRLGYMLTMPHTFNQMAYYGRGPQENYADRKDGAFFGVNHFDVRELFTNYPKPQEMGNREDVRWVTVTNQAGEGALFIGGKPMSVSVLPWSPDQLRAAQHPYQLPESDGTYINLDASQTGLGGASCGQGTALEEQTTFAVPTQFGFIIRPAGKNQKVVANVARPLLISRADNGDVSINGAEEATVLYSINGAKAQVYSAPFNLKQGGTVKAWLKEATVYTSQAQFDKIEAKTTILFCSSAEGSDPATNLLDRDPSTIWHTAYSVTVANYPHWIDFDCSETKTIKGFMYLPRQDGPNGNIKDYEIMISQDGKTWSAPVAKGSFENNAQKKTVQFQPVKARYLRFRALSSQNGQDFASGATMSVLFE